MFSELQVSVLHAGSVQYRSCECAGNQVVVEEQLTGPEISVLAFSDGYTVVPLPAAQDHKRIGEGDVGLNTGGMGAYAPAPVASPAIMKQIMEESLRPTIDGMRRDGQSLPLIILHCLTLGLSLGFPFVGMLFTGFMLTSNGPKVLEYNVRFGDPETEALVLLLDQKADLAAILLVSSSFETLSSNISSTIGLRGASFR